MENAADALKMAFALFVFVFALSIIFIMTGRAKTTADTVLFYVDDTNFHEHTSSNGTNRTVGISDIVATLYRYNTESVAVNIKLKDDNNTNINFDLGYETDINGNKIKLNSKEAIEKNLGDFIEDSLMNINQDSKFTEEFTEVATSGIYSAGEDGSEVTLSSGGKKVYITYTQI